MAFIEEITPIADKASCEVMLAVPYTAIKTLADKVKGTKIIIGAQNMNDASEGAFTGEVAAVMLKDAGAQFVLLGHSERRQIFNEGDALINRKVVRALESGIAPLLCVGETVEERQANKTEEVLKRQLSIGLKDVDKKAVKSLKIAYEPVWAIGTGLAADPETVEAASKLCRDLLGEIFDTKAAALIPLLYGGSVSPKNAESFLDCDDVDGLLIGSASLATDSFAKILSLRQNG